MKKTAIIITALLTGAAWVRADQPPKLDYSVTTSFSYASQYIFRGVKRSSDAFQPSLEVDSNNFDVGVWTSQPVTSGQQNEVDFYGGYKYAVTKDLTVQGVLTYYYYPQFAASKADIFHGNKDSVEPGIGATYTIWGFSPSVFYYHDFTLESDVVQGSLGYALPIPAIGTELDLSAYVGTSSANDFDHSLPGPNVHESYNYYGADVSLPYKLAPSTTLTVGAHYAGNDKTPPGTSHNHGWFTVAITAGF